MGEVVNVNDVLDGHVVMAFNASIVCTSTAMSQSYGLPAKSSPF